MMESVDQFDAHLTVAVAAFVQNVDLIVSLGLPCSCPLLTQTKRGQMVSLDSFSVAARQWKTSCSTPWHHL